MAIFFSGSPAKNILEHSLIITMWSVPDCRLPHAQVS